MMQWFTRLRRTHTPVSNAETAFQERQNGQRSALRSVACVQLSAQMILWVTFFGYDQAEQAVWQAALMLFLPVLLLWLLWRGAQPGLSLPSARFLLLPLLLCLVLDAALLLGALSGFISQLMPQYPAWVSVVIPSAMCYASALLAGRRGVNYGLALLKAPLMVLFVFGTLFLRASSRADRLWPLLGQGVCTTALAALGGTGGIWGVCLLFCLPASGENTRRGVGWALIPWLLCVMWALWHSFVRPWVSEDSLAIGEKMMGLARHASSVILYEVAGVMWMLLIPSALTACFSTAERLLSTAVPRFPSALSLLLLPLCLSVLMLCGPGQLWRAAAALGPYRAAVSVGCACALLFSGRRSS